LFQGLEIAICVNKGEILQRKGYRAHIHS